MKFKKIKLIVTIICIAAFSYIFWNYEYKPSMLWHETYWSNISQISSGISHYRHKFGRLPTSLKEVVSAGFLPEKSYIYSCPMKHGTHSGKVLPYTECEYTFTFDPDKIVIYIPKELFDDWRYRRIDENHRKREVLKEYPEIR
ncbi:MAG: hypothetical protein JW902_04050 [Syntrophaceae bacterium]|nr:hypothetical protein [Syntrophaceae bacterium]